MSTIMRQKRNASGTRTPSLYEMICDSVVSREKIKQSTQRALLEWLKQSERLVIARDHYHLAGSRWVDFASRIGVDRTSAYRLVKLWPLKVKVLKRCKGTGHYPGWETCLDWFTPDASGRTRPEAGMRYWLTPPELKAALDREFPGYWDACPYPRPKGFDGLAKEWPPVSWVNAPFYGKDELHGRGITHWVQKAVAQAAKGKTVAIVIPTYSAINLLLEAGAEARSLGRVKWRDIDSGAPSPHPPPSTLFILRPEKRGCD
jgi:hypothetical protein